MSLLDYRNQIAFTPSIPFTHPFTYMSKIMTANIVFTPNETDKKAGYVSQVRLTGNSVNTISFTGFKKVSGSLTFDNTVLNVILMWWDGDDFWYNIIRESGVGAGGLTQLATPTLVAGTPTATTIPFTWNDVANESSYVVEIATDSGFVTIVSTLTPAAGATSQTATGLTASTPYFARIRAIGDGVTYSNSNNSSTVTATTTSASTFLTWATLGADMEQYNSSKGIRKKSGAAGAWNTTGKALAVQTLSAGQSVVMDLGAAPADSTALVLSDVNTADIGVGGTSLRYVMYVGYGGNAFQAAQNNSNLGASVSYSGTDFLRLKYAADGLSMTWEKSVDGTTWTVERTSTIAPSGSYYISVQSYDQLAGFNEISKV